MHGLTITPEQVEQASIWGRAAKVAMTVGLRPSSEAIVVLVPTFTLGLIRSRIAAILAMSAGTAITVSALALAARGIRNPLEPPDHAGMKIWRKLALVSFTTGMWVPFISATPAYAHSFNVALVVSNSSSGTHGGREIYQGFLLATAERDSHPAQESDGHLGGLDVYITVINERNDVSASIMRLAERSEVDIVAAFTSQETQSLIRILLEGKAVALLLPGQTPFSRTDLPAVAAFKSAYKHRYGTNPTSGTAQGYNAARRIDVAVRTQGGVGDTALLVRTIRHDAAGRTGTDDDVIESVAHVFPTASMALSD